jgi:Flp pilus assembly protein TadG
MGALSILSAAWTLATSRPGLMAVAGLVSFAWGYHKASSARDAAQAAREAAALRAQLAERARQATASAAIAAQDRLRAQAAAGAAAAMQAEIDRLRNDLAADLAAASKREPPHAEGKTKTLVVDACALDAAFARRVRRLDAAGKR